MRSAARAGRFTKSAATPTSSRRKPAGCSPRTRRSTLSAVPPPLERPRDEGAPRVRLQVLPEGLQAASTSARRLRLGNGIDIDVKPNTGQPGAARLRDAAGAHQDHRVRAAPARARRAHVPRGDLGPRTSSTLNCVGYDHNWVKQYIYEDDAAPLLPKGTIVHLIGFLDTTPANKNPADPRNWAGGGRRSIANMFIDLGYSVSLTEEQFQAEMAKRRAEHEEPQRLRHRLPALLGAAACRSRRPRRAAARQPAVMRASVSVRSRRRAAARRSSIVLLVVQRRGAQTRFTYSSGPERSIPPTKAGAERRRLVHACSSAT